jgi:hypothetical protein
MISAIKTRRCLRLGVVSFTFLYALRKAIELHRSRRESLLDLNKLNEGKNNDRRGDFERHGREATD